MKLQIKADNPAFGKVVDTWEKALEKDLANMAIDLDGKGEEARSAELYSILSSKVGGEAMSQVRATEEGEGLMAWRRLYVSFNPSTLSGMLMKIIEAVRPAKIQDLRKVNAAILEWEKKFREVGADLNGISEQAKTAIMASMLPEEIYEVVIQNVEKGEKTVYSEMREKVFSMVTSRIARNEFKVMEVGLAAKNAEDPELCRDLDAVGANTRCYSCGGFGHMQAQCPKGKGNSKGGGKCGFGYGGKGGGKDGGGKGANQKGWGKGEKGQNPKGGGKGYQGVCWRCNKVGHKASECFVNINEVEGEQWEEGEDSEVRVVEGVWLIGGMEKTYVKEEVVNASELAGSDDGWAVKVKKGKLGKMKPQKKIAEKTVPDKNWKDFGDVMQELEEKGELIEGEVREINLATKETDAKCQMMFHVTDSKRMLAAVSRIMEAGNSVLFSKKWGCYIENDITGSRMTMKRVRGVFVVEAKIWNGKEFEIKEIVIDSGAADNVMPKDMLEGLKLLEKEAGVRFQGANGVEMENVGRRKISFNPTEWGF